MIAFKEGGFMAKDNKQMFLTKKANYFFIALYVLAIILLFLIFKPYLSFLILGAILVIFFYPVNRKVQSWVKNKTLSSAIMIILILLFITAPTFYIASTIAHEASNAYRMMASANLDRISSDLQEIIGADVDLKEVFLPLTSTVINYVSESIPTLINSIAELVISLFLMFFLMFYGFKEGDKLLKSLMDALPISKGHKKEITDESNKVLYGVLYGQILIALIQGFLGGLGFWVFGIPNPVLWGFIMAIFSFIPFLGTPIVWLPASLMELAAGNYFAGIGMLLFGGIVVMNIDNILKPKIIGDRSGMHPVLVLVGIFGGIQLFGVIGMIIGPVVVALCVLIIKFFNRDVVFS